MFPNLFPCEFCICHDHVSVNNSDTSTQDAKTTVAGTVLDTITCSTTSGTAMTYEILDVWPNLPGGANWNTFFAMDASKLYLFESRPEKTKNVVP